MRTPNYKGPPFFEIGHEIWNRLGAIGTTTRTWVNSANLNFALPV